MSYFLFLDDERRPWDVKWVDLPPRTWTIVRNYRDFVSTITRRGVPLEISFDHDLALEHYPLFEKHPNPERIPYESYKEKTGWHAAKWLLQYCHEHGKDLPTCYVHSQNPWGKKNILRLLGEPVVEEVVLESGIIIP